MRVVKQYGRNAKYDFEKDENLNWIMKNSSSCEAKQNVRMKKTLGFDGFMSIWLLTLPEKFKEYYERGSGKKGIPDETDIFNLRTIP